MTKLLLAVKSKTVWAVILMWLITYAPMIKNIVPDKYKPLADAIISILAILWKLYPSQNYNPVIPPSIPPAV